MHRVLDRRTSVNTLLILKIRTVIAIGTITTQINVHSKTKTASIAKIFGRTAKMCRKKKLKNKDGKKKEKTLSIEQLDAKGKRVITDEGVCEGLTGKMYQMYYIYRCKVKRKKPLYVSPKIYKDRGRY